MDLVAGTVRSITALIRDGDLMPGDRLPSEANLGTSLGVSRTVVREAFRSLAGLGLVDLAAGKRATISTLDSGALSLIMEHGVQTDQINILQVYDARRTIEVRTATLASLRRSDAEAAEIQGHAQAMHDYFSELERGMESDIAFHLAIAKASRNPVLSLLVGAFADVTRKTWPIGWRSRRSDAERHAMVEVHIELAAAIADGDQAEASKLMARHFDDSIQSLIQAGVA
jgi:DNA-binding FadR family transcriptional regulator